MPLIKPPLGSQIDRSNPLAQGLSSLWAMNEGSGPPRDLAGVQHVTFPASGAPTWTAGPRGPALAFSSTGGISTIPGLTVGTRYTIAGRLRTLAGSNSFGAVITQGNSVGLFGKGTTSLQLYPATEATNVLTVGRWADITVVQDAGQIAYYVDGLLAASGAGTPAAMAGWSLNSLGNDSGGERFVGEIDWLAVWPNRTLGLADAQALAADPGAILRTPSVRRFFVSAAGGTVAVGADASAAWNTRSLTGLDALARWNTLTLAGSDAATNWSVRASVGVDASATWQTRITAGQDAGTQWQTLGTVGNDASANWAVRSLAGADAEATWNVASTLVLVTVGADAAASWSVRALTGSDAAESWNVRASVGADAATSWDTQTLAGADASAVWDLLSNVALVTVGADASASWSVRTRAGADGAASWDVLSNTVEADDLLTAIQDAFLVSSYVDLIPGGMGAVEGTAGQQMPYAMIREKSTRTELMTDTSQVDIVVLAVRVYADDLDTASDLGIQLKDLFEGQAFAFNGGWTTKLTRVGDPRHDRAPGYARGGVPLWFQERAFHCRVRRPRT